MLLYLICMTKESFGNVKFKYENIVFRNSLYIHTFIVQWKNVPFAK